MNKSHSLPNYCQQPPPPPCHCHHHHPPPPKLVNGYPRWNRHRRLYRSHLRMNNVDWASDDEEEPVYQYQYHYQYPYHYQYHYPCNNEQPMEDEYSYDSYPVSHSSAGSSHPSTTSSHTSTSSTKSKSTKSTKKTKSTKSTKNTCKTDTSGRWTATNDEKWTIASNNNDEEDCSCISGETNLSHDVHNYIVG